MAKKQQDASPTLISRFREIASIPHPSKSEEQLREWVKRWAADQGFTTRQDEAGNLVVYVPGRRSAGAGRRRARAESGRAPGTPRADRSPGSASADGPPPVALQGHLDMVCAVADSVTHDCSKEGIEVVQEGDWLSGSGTSLGADDGVAIAAAMTIAEDYSLAVPPLELVFTVEEETGMTGAQKLSGDLLSARYLINLDAQLEGTFVIGSAGGSTAKCNLPVQRERIRHDEELFEVRVSGLRGGHSGLDIGRNRANAIRLLASLLAAPKGTRIAVLEGGEAGNAIPKRARALLCYPQDRRAEVRGALKEVAGKLRDGIGGGEPDLHMMIGAPDEAPRAALEGPASERLVAMLRALPHGPTELLPDRPGQIMSSWNLAGVELKQGAAEVTVTQRSASSFSLKRERSRVSAVAQLAGATVTFENEYPPWEPNPESELLARAQSTYRSLFRRAPELLVAHGGLEVSFLQRALPDVEMLSVGPTIEHAHTPNERLSVGSFQRLYRLLVALLADFSQG